jgi:hypothetical protein
MKKRCIQSSGDACSRFFNSGSRIIRKRENRYFLWFCFFLGVFIPVVCGDAGQKSTFYSFLSKNQSLPAPETRFSYNDRISLHTTWTGLEGAHEKTIVWIAPENDTYQTNRVKFTVPTGKNTFQTMGCCLSFKKKKIFLSTRQITYFGLWRVQLFLDGKFLSEYSFQVF